MFDMRCTIFKIGGKYSAYSGKIEVAFDTYVYTEISWLFKSKQPSVAGESIEKTEKVSNSIFAPDDVDDEEDNGTISNELSAEFHNDTVSEYYRVSKNSDGTASQRWKRRKVHVSVMWVF